MNVCIIGLGLIGGSLARAFKESTKANVFAFDLNDSVLSAAKEEGVIDGICDSRTLKKTDYLFLCLYPGASVEYLKTHALHLNKKATVCDTCGTKARVCAACEALAETYGFHFIGGHPMAGTQFSGFQHSRANLFRGASMILCPRPTEDQATVKALHDLMLSLGFGLIQYTTPQEHDRMIAYTSQLAHVVSNAYVKSPCALAHRGFSAGSFKDLTRVARLNPTMWTELFLENRENLSEEIDLIIRHLSEYRDALNANDADTLWRILDEGTQLKKKSERLLISGESACKP